MGELGVDKQLKSQNSVYVATEDRFNKKEKGLIMQHTHTELVLKTLIIERRNVSFL